MLQIDLKSFQSVTLLDEMSGIKSDVLMKDLEILKKNMKH